MTYTQYPDLVGRFARSLPLAISAYMVEREIPSTLATSAAR